MWPSQIFSNLFESITYTISLSLFSSPQPIYPPPLPNMTTFLVARGPPPAAGVGGKGGKGSPPPNGPPPAGLGGKGGKGAKGAKGGKGATIDDGPVTVTFVPSPPASAPPRGPPRGPPPAGGPRKIRLILIVNESRDVGSARKEQEVFLFLACAAPSQCSNEELQYTMPS